MFHTEFLLPRPGVERPGYVYEGLRPERRTYIVIWQYFGWIHNTDRTVSSIWFFRASPNGLCNRSPVIYRRAG
jgi:hypothetical protein